MLKCVGTPNEDNWPGIHNNEDFLSYRFDQAPAQSLIHRAPRLDTDGLDLLNKFLSVCLLFLHYSSSFIDFILFISSFFSMNSMKPKSGSQRRTRCVIPIFVHWDRWCTKYQTVNQFSDYFVLYIIFSSFTNQLLTFLFLVSSIFTCQGIQLTRDPGYRPAGHGQHGHAKSRRQSMLL